MKKYLTKRNIILVVLCVVLCIFVVGGCVSYQTYQYVKVEQEYMQAIDAAAYAANNMMKDRGMPENNEAFHELRDEFIVAKTQLFDRRDTIVTLDEHYNFFHNKYPKALQLIRWYSDFNVVIVPLTFDAFAEGSTDEFAQKLFTATQILTDHRSRTRIVNGISVPQSFEEYLQCIEDDPRTAELGFEDTWAPSE